MLKSVMQSLFSQACTPVCWCHGAEHSDSESVHYQSEYTADRVQLNVSVLLLFVLCFSRIPVPVVVNSGARELASILFLSSPAVSLSFSLSCYTSSFLFLSHPQRREVSLYLCGDCWQWVQCPWDAKLAMPAVRSIHAGWPRPHCPTRLCQAAGSCWLTSLLFLLHVGISIMPMQPHLRSVAMLWAHHIGTGLVYSEQGSCVLFTVSQSRSKVHPGVTFSLLFLKTGTRAIWVSQLFSLYNVTLPGCCNRLLRLHKNKQSSLWIVIKDARLLFGLLLWPTFILICGDFHCFVHWRKGKWHVF